MKTGVKFVDESSSAEKSTAFKKTVNSGFIFDYDYFFLNDPLDPGISSLEGLKYQKSIPSLLFCFAIAENSILETKLLELILRCFS
jgi:hypothetical protein